MPQLGFRCEDEMTSIITSSEMGFTWGEQGGAHGFNVPSGVQSLKKVCKTLHAGHLSPSPSPSLFLSLSLSLSLSLPLSLSLCL